jgi:hypothetical protein
VRQFFLERTLRRRAVALIAAYAIALSSLFASFATARAAAEAAAVPGGVICHTDVIGRQAPTSDQGKVCVDDCCVGCLILTAALPPPPTKVIDRPQSASQVLPPPEITVLAAGTFTKSHRSRAPPLTA